MTEETAMQDPALVDPREFARFLITGIVATIGNLGVVWLLRESLPYPVALGCGIATGFVVSFVLTRLFAFRPAQRDGPGETLARFLVVYVAGVAVNMTVAMVAGHGVLPHWLDLRDAEMAGAFLGAGFMTVTSYLGHRFFTYRTGRTN